MASLLKDFLEAVELLLVGLVPVAEQPVVRLFLLHLVKHFLFVLNQFFVILAFSLQLLLFRLDLDLLIIKPVLQLLMERRQLLLLLEMCVIDHTAPHLNIEDVVMLLLDRLNVASKVLQIVSQHLLPLTVGVPVLIFAQLEIIPESFKHLQLPDADLAALATRRLIVRILDHELVGEAALGLDTVLTALLAAELAPVL